MKLVHRNTGEVSKILGRRKTIREEDDRGVAVTANIDRTQKA